MKATAGRGHPRIFYGWLIVVASALVFYYTSGSFFYGFSVFFNPIRNEFGWSAAMTAVVFTMRTLEGGIAVPIVGHLVDRHGPRKMGPRPATAAAPFVDVTPESAQE